MKFAALDEWLAWLEQLHPSTIDLGLDRVRSVAERAGLLDPPFPVVIVGGTNGKGSVCAVLESILRNAGYSVGLYTSPHIINYNERVRITAQEVDDETLCAAFDDIERVRDQTTLTYFEFGTLAAMRVFQQRGVDVAIMEVGLGGRLDAVNIWDAEVSVITSLALDHTDWLGDSLDDIAFEKSGIARGGRPLIVGEPQPPPRLFDRVAEIGADNILLGRNFNYHCHSDGRWDFSGVDTEYRDLPSPGIGGGMRYANSAIALQVLDCLRQKFMPTAEQLVRGIASASTRGRAQRVSVNGRECLFDVAHNPQAISAFVDYLSSTMCGGKTLAVVGFMADKAIAEMLGILSSSFDRWYVGDLPTQRAIPSAELAELIDRHVVTDIEVHSTISEAFHRALADASANDRIVVFGSFITVAEVLPLTL